jgi:hydroxymethylbilane synthase
MKQILIGTRGSPLALWQANWVKASLEARNPNLTISLKIIKTKGDKILDVSLSKVGGKGLFHF